MQKCYQNTPLRRYYEDKKMLIYAITWPATWFNERGLTPSQEKYEQLINHVLNDIVAHGDHQRYTQYFPRYLLKCIQQWFHYNGDHLYEELKHIRNQLFAVDHLIDVIKQNNKDTAQLSDSNIQTMKNTHHLLKSQLHQKRKKSDHNQLQLNLF